ncbi:MAG: hypothetical protein ACRC0L_03150 [Angustibacter sp.]
MTMTEQLAQPEVLSPRLTEHRVVRVNLLPEEVGAARRLRGVQVVLSLALLGLVAGLGALYIFAANGKADAEDSLASATAQTVNLQKEKSKYDEVPATLAAIDAAAASRETAMQADVEWYRVMSDLSYAQLTKAWFTSLTMRVNTEAAVASTTTPNAAGSTAGGTTPNAAAGTAATATDFGEISVEGYAFDHPNVADWLETFTRQAGLDTATFSNSSREKIDTTGVVKFQSSAPLKAEALSNRFKRTAAQP